MEEVVYSELVRLERRASELVKLYRQHNPCATLIELFSGEDDGMNRTYTYFAEHGLLLPRVSEVLGRLLSSSEYMPYGGGGWRVDVLGAYAVSDGIVVQLHKVVINDYGNPVKDYGSFPCLRTLLSKEQVRAAVDEIIAALREDVEELERGLNKVIENPVRSYTVEKPPYGHVVAICPVCREIIRPSCEERTLLGEMLVFVHEHTPVFIVMSEGSVRCTGSLEQSLIDIVERLWVYHKEDVENIEKIVSAWLQLRREEEYEEGAKAFFSSL